MNRYQTHVTKVAKDVWCSDEDADRFMHHPHPLLERRTPFDIAETEEGAKRVETILQKIRWGLPV